MTPTPGALVVDPDRADRARVVGLLRMAGWTVREAADSGEAVHTARGLDLDLVVTDLSPEPGAGAALLRRLRLVGCQAHLVTVSADPGPQLRAAARAAGALACLPKPVDAGLLLSALRARVRTGAAAERFRAGEPDDLDDDLVARLQILYAGALPGRLVAIREGARSGDPAALATASNTLAGVSAQLGHHEVAAVCRAIARGARRGVLAHDLVAELTGPDRQRPGTGPDRQRPGTGPDRRRPDGAQATSR